MVFNK